MPKTEWDVALPYIAMGYKMSKHAFLAHFSPYFMLFGHEPMPPSAIAKQLQHVVDLDNPAVWAKVIGDRAALFRQVMPMAMANLHVAQHRDTLRYAYTRSGSFRPKLKKFQFGDFVYLQRQTSDTLDTTTSRHVLRIREVRPNGVLLLQGADGRTITDHTKNCALCHLPNFDPTIVTADWVPPADYPCQVCHRVDDAELMLLCDGCDGGFHLFCLDPPLTEVPDQLWYCPKCVVPAANCSQWAC